MSVLLEEVDRALGTVRDGPACLLPFVRRHPPGAENLPVALAVLAEKLRNEVVAAAMTLAALRVDPQLHHVIPLSGPRPSRRGRAARTTPGRRPRASPAARARCPLRAAGRNVRAHSVTGRDRSRRRSGQSA